MYDDEVFLGAIRADPADEALWLIYADWLEERGDPRAALYRRRRLTNSIGMKLVLVPRGTFWMGMRGSQRQAAIPHEFYLGAYPVTQGQWQAVTGNTPSWFSRGRGGFGRVQGISDADLKRFPVEQVSWDEVQEFLQRLNALEKGSGLRYRLPADAERGYACRGAASSQEDCAFGYFFARPTNDLSSEQANINGNYPAGVAPQGQCLERTTKVGSYQPNRLGLYDVHGNVWEWCADADEAEGPTRVLRGGSWYDLAAHCGRRAAAVPSSGGGAPSWASASPQFRGRPARGTRRHPATRRSAPGWPRSGPEAYARRESPGSPPPGGAG
jgi:uncharacterized protein (TIGR02996 family)